MKHNLRQFAAAVQGPTHDVPELGRETAAETSRDWASLDWASRDWGRLRDEEIRLAVMTALHWNLAVPRDCIEVKVKGGWVTLTGQVRREYEKTCPEADARMTSGVVGVTNQIDCKPA